MQRQTGRKRWGLVALCLVLGHIGGIHAAFPPVRFSGEFGYDFQFENLDRGGTITEHLGILNVKASTFLYEPWIAQTEGSLGLTFRNSELDSERTTATVVTGDARLRLFPMSRFPFEAYVERTNSTVDSKLSGVDFDLTRIGALQRYTSPGGTGLRMKYEHQDLTQDTGNLAGAAAKENDVVNLFQFGANRAFGKHSLTLDSDVQLLDRNDSTDRVNTIFALLRDSYRSGPRLSAEHELTYNRLALKQRDVDFSSGLLQFNSYGFWRPETSRPLLLNGTLRALRLSTDTASESSTDTSFTGTVGASYEWNPRLLFTADGGITRTDSENDQLTTTFQRLGATYTSDDKDIFGFHYNWFAGGSAENSTDEIGALQTASVSLGHNLTRSFALGPSLLALSSNQSTNAIVDTEGRSVQILLHDLALTWSMQELSRSTMARLSASDSRTFGGGGREGNEASEFQLINFQASVDQRLGRASSLNGDITMQAIRQSRGNGFFGSANIDDSFQPVATMALSYINQQFLNVPRLRLRSTLRFISDSYLPLLQEPQDPFRRDDMDWENRLEYDIGRTEVRLIGRLSEFRDNGRSLIVFQVRRFFGDL